VEIARLLRSINGCIWIDLIVKRYYYKSSRIMRYRYCILLILVSVAYTIVGHIILLYKGIGSVQQAWGDYSTNVIDYDSLKVIAVTFVLKHFQNEKKNMRMV